MSTNGRHHSKAWIAHYKPNPNALLRLFCFPYAGSSASVYRTWQDLLPDFVEVCPVQLPGRGTRFKEAAFTHLSPLITALVHYLTPYLLDKPFAFFGHSMGALISFELAQALQQQQVYGLHHLFVSGRGAPHIPDPNPHLSHLSDTEFIERLRDYKGTPENVLQNDELMSLFLPLLRADFAVCETYTYRKRSSLACPITAFGGTEDVTAPYNRLSAWRNQTTDSFSHYLFEGDHFFIHSARPALLHTISQELNTMVEQLTLQTFQC